MILERKYAVNLGNPLRARERSDIYEIFSSLCRGAWTLSLI